MTLYRQSIFWGSAALLFGALLIVLWDVALPFLVALVLAYLLDPLVIRLQRFGMNRLAATLVIMAIFLVVLAFLMVLGIPAIAHQIAALVARMPDDVVRLQGVLLEYLTPILERFGNGDLVAQVQKSMGDLAGQAVSWFGSFLTSLVAGGQAVISFLSLVVITPVAVFYLLLDWKAVQRWFIDNLPQAHRGTLARLAREIGSAIDGFFRGQLLVCLFLGGFYAFGLWLVGLNSGITIGLIAGLISFIPYIGSLTGLFLSVGVAIAQFWPDWTMIVATLCVFLVGQFIEGNILSPKLVGDAIGVHPVWLMFALFAFGSLLGFGGLLIAAPMAAVLGVLIRFALQRYRASVFYRGEADA